MPEWFRGDPSLVKRSVRVVNVHWSCPKEECEGEMIFNGFTWPTGIPGYHHTCNQCKYTAVVSGLKFPRIEYIEE